MWQKRSFHLFHAMHDPAMFYHRGFHLSLSKGEVWREKLARWAGWLTKGQSENRLGLEAKNLHLPWHIKCCFGVNTVSAQILIQQLWVVRTASVCVELMELMENVKKWNPFHFCWTHPPIARVQDCPGITILVSYRFCNVVGHGVGHGDGHRVHYGMGAVMRTVVGLLWGWPIGHEVSPWISRSIASWRQLHSCSSRYQRRNACCDNRSPVFDLLRVLGLGRWFDVGVGMQPAEADPQPKP